VPISARVWQRSGDLIIKVELAEPWNSNRALAVEVDRGLFFLPSGFGVKQKKEEFP
jgi:hypothetical protein